MRVVSLLPSATESLCAIGAGDLLVGRSHECDFPLRLPGQSAAPGAGPAADRPIHSIPVLTAARTPAAAAAGAGAIDAAVRAAVASGESLYTVDEAALAALRPDLILTQDLCRVCSIDLAAVRRVAERLEPRPSILSLNPASVEDVLDDLLRIGDAVGRPGPALAATAALRDRLHALSEFVNPFEEGPIVAFLEWTDPLFAGGHWTPQLIERAGGRHPLNPTEPLRRAGAAAGPVGSSLRVAGPSVTVPAEVLSALRPDVVVIAPCGLDLAAARREAAALARQPWFSALPAARSGRVAVVDGNQMFNRPGPRLLDAFAFLVGYLTRRPEILPAGFPWEPLRPGG